MAQPEPSPWRIPSAALISDEAAPDLSKMSVGQINNWLKTLQEKPKPKQPKASAGASSSRFWGD